MSHDQWNAVDAYFNAMFVPEDAVLEAALRASDEAGLPQINVAPNQGKLLYLLTRIKGARTILEVGTLAGYSTIWLARAAGPDGHVVTLELDAKHADVARSNFAAAGLSQQIDLRVGTASDSLAQLESEGAGPFDLVFIDADKVSTPIYVAHAMNLTRAGSLIIVDNVVRRGGVADPEHPDPNVQGIRTALAQMADDPRLEAVALQTVGEKGWDGLSIALRIR